MRRIFSHNKLIIWTTPRCERCGKFLSRLRRRFCLTCSKEVANERCSKRQVNWEKNNKEEWNRKQKEWRDKNKEHCNLWRRNYRKAGGV